MLRGAIIVFCETWLRGGKEQDNFVNTLENGHAIKSICRNRRSRGGCVAILYNLHKINVAEHRFGRKNFEIVAAKGTMAGPTGTCLHSVFTLNRVLPQNKKRRWKTS